MTTTIKAKFATARDVANAIASLGFQASNESIGAISRNCREEFLEHLSKCIAGQDQDGLSKKTIGNLIRCLSPDMVARIKAFAPEATIDRIVPLAKSVPTRLLSAIEAAGNPQHDRHDDAKAYLVAVFASTPAGAPPSNQIPPSPAPTHNERAPSDQPASSSRRQPEATDGKKYNSCHVYGSGYALCFNAGQWEGKPGVMVDAAVSDGPKSYDWRTASHIWLDTNEVGAVLAVFRRWRKGIEFAAHGAQNDKAFSIEFQGQHFYAKVTAKKAGNHPTRAVKIMPTDATAVSILFLTQLAESYPAIPLNELLATVRATHQINDAAAA